ncbi:MAG TPA: DM13 domain-containing protein [Candidatus Peribacteraceae bacterium]|nr:DM13 domain-containing protein [Candidatus Peribacteraceae bacterium]
MKYSPILPAVSLLFLAACSGAGGGTSLDQKLQNPLYAQKYYEDLVSHMVSLQIHNDPILKKSDIKSVVDKARLNGVTLAQNAAKQKDKGPHGIFVSDNDEVAGSVLLLGTTLYIGPDFYLAPGPSTHFYLTTVTDPRTVQFPDNTAVDLGPVQDAYGAQTLHVPSSKDTAHTLVLFDTQMKKIFGFAQLAE